MLQAARGRITPAQVVILALSLALFVLSATAAYPAGVFWTKSAGGWTSDLIVEGHATEATNFVPAGNCGVGPLPRIEFPAGGAGFLADFGRFQCADDGGPFGVLEAEAPGQLWTRAVFTATGMVLYVPAAPSALTHPHTYRANALRNEGEDAAFLLIVNEGHGGTVLATVYDGQGVALSTESVQASSGVTFVQLGQAFKIGSVELHLGYSDGSFRPGGPVWAWATSGPMSNSSAARVVPFIAVAE